MDALLSTSARWLPRRRLLLGGAALAAAAGIPSWHRSSPDAAATPYRLDGTSMGTRYTVKIAGRVLSAARLEAVHADVHAALAAIDERMSLHRPTSELSRLNAHPAGRVVVSPALFAVLDAALEAAAASGGAFDPTVAPLVEAWGFGPAGARDLPQPAELALKRPAVGYERLGLEAATRTVTKASGALALDLGGIAKGRAVDDAAQALLAAGIEHFMVEAGGEIRTNGRNGHGRPWAIGIEEPDAWPSRARLVLPLGGEAIATSGDYRLYVEHAGRRYPHAIDPFSAAPIAHGLASVSVITGDAMRADALATGLLVLGLERGLALADRLGLPVHFISRDTGGHLHDHPSAALRRRQGLPLV
jgi:thiamine biosynthesis lipoprotein